MTVRYRWLTQGETYRYSAAVGKGLDVRRGQSCRVLILPRPGTRTIDMPDARITGPVPSTFGPSQFLIHEPDAAEAQQGRLMS